MDICLQYCEHLFIYLFIIYLFIYIIYYLLLINYYYQSIQKNYFSWGHVVITKTRTLLKYSSPKTRKREKET